MLLTSYLVGVVCSTPLAPGKAVIQVDKSLETESSETPLPTSTSVETSTLPQLMEEFPIAIVPT